MKELPTYNFSDGFYIWFDIDRKKEFYSTPNYQYKTKSKGSYSDGKQTIKLEKSIKKCKPNKSEIARKFPACISFPYEENLGNMLVRFLNANLSDFESAYDTFLYAYGFELIKEYETSPGLLNSFTNDIELLNTLKSTYENAKEHLTKLQADFKQCVDYIYSTDDNSAETDIKPISKFISSVIKGSSDINTYSKDIEVILDNYKETALKYTGESLESLANKIEQDRTLIVKRNVYTSPYLSSILYVILKQLVSSENITIRKCLNCSKYFIPITSIREIYCDFDNLDGTPSCRDKGAGATYKKNLESIPALLEYRRTYQKKIMIASRNREDKQLRLEFDKWKSLAQAKIKAYKKGDLSEEELYNWMIENK